MGIGVSWPCVPFPGILLFGLERAELHKIGCGILLLQKCAQPHMHQTSLSLGGYRRALQSIVTVHEGY